VGTKTFNVMASDGAGNTAAQSVTYTVGYVINATFDQTKANKSGSTVQIKLQLLNAANVNQSSSAIVVTAVSVLHLPDNTPAPLQAPGNSNPDLTFKLEGNNYAFGLKTTGYAAGTYVLNFRAGSDPVIHSVQFLMRE
jgi:hypothetical protein